MTKIIKHAKLFPHRIIIAINYYSSTCQRCLRRYVVSRRSIFTSQSTVYVASCPHKQRTNSRNNYWWMVDGVSVLLDSYCVPIMYVLWLPFPCKISSYNSLQDCLVNVVATNAHKKISSRSNCNAKFLTLFNFRPCFIFVGKLGRRQLYTRKNLTEEIFLIRNFNIYYYHYCIITIITIIIVVVVIIFLTSIFTGFLYNFIRNHAPSSF